MANNWAICIGINQYDDLQPLKYAVRDAEQMKEWLINKGGFPKSQVYYFSDNAPPITDASTTFKAKPTYAALYRFLNRRFKKPFLKSGDNLWFFFSGHGSRYLERDYLMLSDSSSNSAEIQQTAISTNFIVERLRKCGADNVMLFIDACREGNKSGRGIELEKEQGIITITSCSPNEFSYEIEELKNGSFTYALLESLDFQGENNCATIERLNRRLRDRVKEINNYYRKPRQTPRTVIEPASKFHLIFLPDYIQPTQNDIAILKTDALKAQIDGNLELAEALWTRLNKFEPEEALTYLRKIWTKSQEEETLKELNSKIVSDKSGKKSINDGKVLSTFEFKVITVNDKGEQVKSSQKKVEYFTEDLGNGVTLDMVSIPGGTFMMGTEEEEIERLCKTYDEEWFREESPQHQVNIPRFFMGRYPITQAQWREVAGWEQVERELNSDPSNFKEDYEDIDRWKRPVEQVSWEDAKEFCARLSNKTKRKRMYRLPTEAEWEYACRSRTNTPFHFGETVSTELANYRGTDWEIGEGDKVYPGNYGRGLKGIYREQTTPVGYFKVANNFGLCDMHGNVWEWCKDDWHNNYEGAPTNGSAWFSELSSIKVIRGGSWDYFPHNCRSACRTYPPRALRHYLIGFRVVCVAGSTT